MKRDILKFKPLGRPCCPGHDKYPSDTYSSNRSKKARAKHIKKEHQTVRAIQKAQLEKELKSININKE